MPDRVEEIAAPGRTLPPEERVRLLDPLRESLNEGNDYRLILAISYKLQIVYVKFVGTHKE